MSESPSTSRPSPRREVTVLQAFTLALWLTWLVIGLLGLWMQQLQRPTSPPPQEPPPIKVETLNVDLTQELEPLLSDATPDNPPDVQAPPDAPPPVAVAIPSPVIAFVLPVEGPAVIAPAARAVPPPLTTAQPKIAGPATPAVRRITYGQGEGRQPEPPYPPQAVSERQQGSVLVRFTVGPDGNVLSAEALIPSRWPLLNHAAVDTVRQSWHFAPGPPRIYEVSIRFQLE